MPDPPHIDVDFAVKDDVRIPLRIWPVVAPSDPPCPWIALIHGGGWSAGSPYMPIPWTLLGFQRKGFHVVSIGYRLSPQVSIFEQLEDCRDGVLWCRHNLETVLPRNGQQVDLSSFALQGGSAGPTFAMILGTQLEPPPRVIVSAYGVSSFARFQQWISEQVVQPPVLTGEFDEAELRQHGRDWRPSLAVTAAIDKGYLDYGWTEKIVRQRWNVGSDRWLWDKRDRLQTAYAAWMARDRTGRNSIMFRLEDDGDHRALLDSVSPLRLDGETSYPPVAFLHGVPDSISPIEQSMWMAEKLKSMGAEVFEQYAENKGHFFDGYGAAFSDFTSPGWKEIIDPILDFVEKCVRRG